MIKNFNIMGAHRKIRFSFLFFFFWGGGRGGCIKKNGGLKRGAWIVFRFKSEIGKRRGHVFEVRRG